MTAQDRASSRGASPRPKRAMLARAPRAELNALPRARNVSSAVWWSSTSLPPLVSLLSGFYCYGGVRNALYKSPLALMAKLHPECFAKACSIWSRNPIPVLMVTCCVAVNCVACSEPGSGTIPSEEVEVDAKCVEGS